MEYLCPVCGFDRLQEKPRGEKTGGSYEICPSCGFQFGVTDDDRGISFEEWRREWIVRGMPWNDEGITDPPTNWNPRDQLRGIDILT